MYKKITVLGLGNILMQDEGVGIHVINELEKQDLPKEIELIDGGTAGLDIFPSLKDTDKLIMIDALKADKTPGTIYRLGLEDLTAGSSLATLSLHQVGVLEILTVLKKEGRAAKEIVIIGIEPKRIGWGLELSSEIKAKIPKITDIIMKETETLEKQGVQNDPYRKKTY